MRKLIVVSFAALTITDAIKLHSHESQGSGNLQGIDSETLRQFGNYLGKFPQNFKNQEEYALRARLYKKNKDEIDRFNREEAPKLGWLKGEN